MLSSYSNYQEVTTPLDSYIDKSIDFAYQKKQTPKYHLFNKQDSSKIQCLPLGRKQSIQNRMPCENDNNLTYKQFQQTLKQQNRPIDKLKLLKNYLEAQQKFSTKKYGTDSRKQSDKTIPFLRKQQNECLLNLKMNQQISIQAHQTSRNQCKTKNNDKILTYRKLSTQKREDLKKKQKKKHTVMLSDYFICQSKDSKQERHFDKKLEQIKRKIQIIQKKQNNGPVRKQLHKKSTKYRFCSKEQTNNSSPTFRLNALIHDNQQILKISQEKVIKETKLSQKLRRQTYAINKMFQHENHSFFNHKI